MAAIRGSVLLLVCDIYTGFQINDGHHLLRHLQEFLEWVGELGQTPHHACDVQLPAGGCGLFYVTQ